MFATDIEYRITSQTFITVCISLIYAALANAQAEGQYLEIRPRTGYYSDGYISSLSKGLHPGGSITVNGTINLDPTKFTISLIDKVGQDGLSNHLYLHIAARFNEQRIAFTYKVNRVWTAGGNEEYMDISSLSKGASFQITITCNSTGYMIDFNKNISYFFNHRFETSIIRLIAFGESCRQKGCTGNNVCIVENGKFACRRRTILDDNSMNNSVQCMAPYVAVDTECIWVVLNKLNWDAARMKCQENGGFLLEPDFPVNFKQYMSINYPEDGKSAFWLGGADRGLDHWVWVTSLMPIPYSPHFPWGKGEPNERSHGVEEDCMSLVGKTYFYNDGKCYKEFFYICEASPLTSAVETELQNQASHQMQVAILLLLIMVILVGAGYFIYKNSNTVQKVYGSLADHTRSFLNYNPSMLNEEEEQM